MLRLSDRGEAALTDLRTPDAIAAGKHPGKPHLRKRVGAAGAKQPGGCDGGVVAPPTLIIEGRPVPEKDAVIGQSAQRLSSAA